MSKAVIIPHEGGPAPDRDPPKPDEIRRQLRSILASPPFLGSKRCQQFLEYVCEQSLTGGSGGLKERSLAIEVFGRHPQSDLGEDTIVRVGAREVRKRLAQYYVTSEGAASEIRIDLPPGAYAPEFRYASAPGEEATAAPAKPARPMAPTALVLEETRRPNHRRAWALAAVVLAAAAGLAVLKWGGPNANTEAFLRFWEPVLKSPEPLLLAVAHPLVYHPSGRALRLNEEMLPPLDVPRQRAIQLPPKLLDGSDMVAVQNQYVGYGDMVAATEVSAMLARKGKSVRIRMASAIDFADLRRAPALLIGAVTNRWTMELQQSWRFRFSWSPGSRTAITDTQDNTGERHWTIPVNDDGSAPDDYMLVCRIRNSFTGGLTLAGAGLKQFGTEAAGRLLADPEQLGSILRKLPPGWDGKNLQIVLHARVLGNTPAQPEVVAWHVW